MSIQLLFLYALCLSGPAGASSNRVEYAVGGTEQHKSETRAALAEGTLGLDIELFEVAQVPTAADALNGDVTATSALARVRVNLLLDKLQLVVSDRTGQEIYVRTVPYSDAQAPLAYEQIEQILHSTLSAMLAGSDDEPTKPVPAPPIAPPIAAADTDRPPSPPPPSWGWEFGAAGSVALYSPELVVLPGVELIAGARWGRGRHHVVARLSGGFQGRSFDSEEVSFALQQFPIFGVLGHRLDLGNWGLETLVGGGIALVRVNLKNTAPDLEQGEGHGFSAGALRLALRLHRRISKGFGAFAAFRADYFAARKNFVVEEDGQTTAVLTPYALHPSLTLGLYIGN